MTNLLNREEKGIGQMINKPEINLFGKLIFSTVNIDITFSQILKNENNNCDWLVPIFQCQHLQVNGFKFTHR